MIEEFRYAHPVIQVMIVLYSGLGIAALMSLGFLALYSTLPTNR